MAMTIIELPEEETRTTLKAGTIVYAMNKEMKLDRDYDVIIEARGNTNYDNQRRAVDPENRLHMFWVQGQDVQSDVSIEELAKYLEDSDENKPA